MRRLLMAVAIDRTQVGATFHGGGMIVSFVVPCPKQPVGHKLPHPGPKSRT